MTNPAGNQTRDGCLRASMLTTIPPAVTEKGGNSVTPDIIL